MYTFLKMNKIIVLLLLLLLLLLLFLLLLLSLSLLLLFIILLSFFLFGGDWQGYHGLRPGVPYIDPIPDYVLISASESNGYTNLQFERETPTEEDDDPHDVQYRVRNTAISRKVDGKSASDNPERHCGWFWVHCSSEKFERIGTKGHGNMFASAKGKQQK